MFQLLSKNNYQKGYIVRIINNAIFKGDEPKSSPSKCLKCFIGPNAKVAKVLNAQMPENIY